MAGEYPGWDQDELGGLTLSITIGGQQVRLATVRRVEAELGELWETYIGLPLQDNQLGRWDASRARAVEKAEMFLKDKLTRLL